MLAFLPGISPLELLILGAIGVLLFGSKLPDVGRSLGRSLMELRKGLKGIEDEIHSVTSLTQRTTTPQSRRTYSVPTDDRLEPTAPKFEPPPAATTPSEPAADPQAQA